MDNNHDDEFDSDDCNDEGDEDEGTDVVAYVPPTPKQVFTETVSRITAALDQHDAVYPQLIAAIEPFDKKLAALVQASANADMQLLRYLQNKAERGDNPSLVDRIFGMLGR